MGNGRRERIVLSFAVVEGGRETRGLCIMASNMAIKE